MPRLDGNGITFSNNTVAFKARMPSNRYGTGNDHHLNFTTRVYNYGNAYNSDGIFKAPVKGIYHFDIRVSFTITTANTTTLSVKKHAQFELLISGEVVAAKTYPSLDPAILRPISLSFDVELEANEYLEPYFLTHADNYAINAPSVTEFTGHLVTTT